MNNFFSASTDRTDGYIRIAPGRVRSVRNSSQAAAHEGLLFIDIDGPHAVKDVVSALQYTQLPITRTVLFRWPDIGLFSNETIESVGQWLAEVHASKLFPSSGDLQLGVVVFFLGDKPVVIWHESSPETEDTCYLNRAMRAEIRALLEWGHAIWKPEGYHYELPSGDHVASFIRIANSFKTLRDIEVFASWFAEKLCDELAIVTDTASLIPLITELRTMMRDVGWQLVGAESLDEYPRTKLQIMEVIASLPPSEKLLAIVSVNASGRYEGLIYDAVQSSALTGGSAEQSEVVVVLDKLASPARSGLKSTRLSSPQLFRWIGLGQESSATTKQECVDCRSSRAPQVVKIDSRSFESLAVSGTQLMMPSYSSALDLADFYTLCSRTGAITTLSPSDAYARPKDTPMGVKFRFGAMLSNPDFVDTVMKRLKKNPFRVDSFDHIVYLATDATTPDGEESAEFMRLLSFLCAKYGVNESATSCVLLDEDGKCSSIESVTACRRVLVFSLGSVSGWTLRQLQLAVEHTWNNAAIEDGTVYGLVILARSTTKREWDNLYNSFSGNLQAVWRLYIAEDSPLREERTQLDNSGAVESIEGADAQDVASFIEERRRICSEESDDPDFVLWGCDEQTHLTNKAIYGHRIRPIATLAAVGSAMHAERQKIVETDPRWPMFDFASIVRSYYDGLLIACMLRWCRSAEIWWGADSVEQSRTVQSLISRTRRTQDQRILFPELLLAASQAKVPVSIVGEMANSIVRETKNWVGNHRAMILVGLLLVAESGLDVKSALRYLDFSGPVEDDDPASCGDPVHGTD